MHLTNPQIVALIIFVIAYTLFILFPNRRPLVAFVGACLIVLLRVLSPLGAIRGINWNVMGVFVGTLALADLFLESGMPAVIAEKIVNRSGSIAMAMLLVCALTGFISIFVENVAAVLIIAPIALLSAKKMKLDPTLMMIGIAISSNLQGTATLIGDPPSMLLGGYAKMTFMDFIIYKGRPSIFFTVELGALASLVVLWLFYRKFHENPGTVSEEKIKTWVPSAMLILMIVALAFSSVIDKEFKWAAGTICMVFSVVCLSWDAIANKSDTLRCIRKLDWETTLFLASIFVLVESLTATGWIDAAAAFLSTLIGGNIVIGFVSLVVFSVVISAFVDNVPYLAAMLPVTITLAKDLGVEPQLFMFGLLIGASLGGNVTPIGASANIVACGLLRKEGYPVKFGTFVKVGLPFTVAAVAASAAFTWLVWGTR